MSLGGGGRGSSRGGGSAVTTGGSFVEHVAEMDRWHCCLGAATGNVVAGSGCSGSGGSNVILVLRMVSAA